MRSLPPLSSQSPKTKYVGSSHQHESAIGHVTGEARYVDDLPEPRDLLHAAIGYSQIACGQISSIDFKEVEQSKGVIGILTVKDIPGHIDIGPVFAGDPLLTDHDIRYFGQPIFVVAATSELAARQAVRKAQINYKPAPPILTEKEALSAQTFVLPDHCLQRGDLKTHHTKPPFTLEGEQYIGGQEHFYLEGQVAMAIPDEPGTMTVYSSSQHPSEVQKVVAEVLGWPLHSITVDMRRMGGGFGGKESQAAPWACMAALLAQRYQRPVKLRLSRQDDMIMTGKRHPFYNQYRVSFTPQGVLLSADIELNGNCGHSPDLSDGIVDRAMFHADNSYYIENVKILGRRCMTNRVSNTAFRGFGGPQGMLVIEQIIDDIARITGIDPLDIRKRNLYGVLDRNITPYHQTLEENWLPELITQLEQESNYRARRTLITQFNHQSPTVKIGLALTPVKFGISFTSQHLNQAGALIHIYTDGSVLLNHGGTEMGQGLHTKVCQIVAQTLQIDTSQIKISATRTDKVPNTSPTAASSGTDLNGQAANLAALELKKRLSQCLADEKRVDIAQIRFDKGQIYWNETESISFAELAQLAYFKRVSLSATGFYKTPKIYYDRENAKGHPFLYFAYGAAVSEVSIDTLTGEYKVNRVDILHDVGSSINPALDIGQIEGGFMQGLGWLTTEELCWDNQGKLATTGPATYKIPAISDLPEILNISLFNRPATSETIYRSKAVGEPPFMLAISVWSALRDAISSISNYKFSPQLDVPATPERVFQAIEQIEKNMQKEPYHDKVE